MLSLSRILNKKTRMIIVKLEVFSESKLTVETVEQRFGFSRGIAAKDV